MHMKMNLDGDGCWPDLIQAVGKVLFAQQSLEQLEAFVRACRAREQYLAGQS